MAGTMKRGPIWNSFRLIVYSLKISANNQSTKYTVKSEPIVKNKQRKRWGWVMKWWILVRSMKIRRLAKKKIS